MSATPAWRILVFAKAPVPGYAKTRLAPRIGAHGAAALHRRLLERTVAVAASAASSLGAAVELWCDPDTRHPALRALAARHGASLHAQTGADLGERMHGAAARALAAGARYLLVGTDVPTLDTLFLARAAAALEDADIVLGPSFDGGYVLIGGRCAPSACFTGVPWGTPGVLAATRAALDAAGVRRVELPALWDLDEPADLDRLAALPEGGSLLAGIPGAPAPYTPVMPASAQR